MKFFAFTPLLLFLASSASAHGDHTSGIGSSLLHELGDPLNLSVLAFAVVLSYGMSRVSRRLSR